MNTQDCSACSEYQNNAVAPACPNCGHMHFAPQSDYDGSLADYELQEQEEQNQYMSDVFERESEELQNYDYVY